MMADSGAPPAATVAAQETEGAGEFLMKEIATADGPRRFKLFVPSRYDKARPAPLLVVLHGCTQDPDDVARGTQFNAIAEAKGMLVAYPEQPMKYNGLKCWNWFDAAHQKRDKGEPALIAAITQQVISEYRVDARRVYIAGLSAGGAMALTVAYAYPEIFAAAGIHSGIAYGATASMAGALKAMGGAADSAALGAVVEQNFGSRRSFPAIIFQGAADKSVNVANASQIVAQLIAQSPQKYAPVSETGGVSPGGYHFTRKTFGHGKSVVEEWIIEELGHAWSGGSKDGTYTDPKSHDAGPEMVRFFLDHPRN